MDIKRSGSQPSEKGPETYFTGTVRIDGRFSGSGGLSAATVTFQPGARTAWHTHPLGQTLLVTAGLGRAQREGGPIEEISTRRHRLVRAGREALARRDARLRDDAYCHCRNEGRLGCHLDGEGHGRAVRRGAEVMAEEGVAPKRKYGLVLMSRIPGSIAQSKRGASDAGNDSSWTR